MAESDEVKHVRYLAYIIRHKWFVFRECTRLGIWRQGITHDLSKLLYDEFLPYASHFYGEARGWTDFKPTNTGDTDFDYAWILHLKRNKHHWQWWCIPDNGKLIVQEMPTKYRKEMLADWIGAGRALHSAGVISWYREHKDKISLGAALPQKSQNGGTLGAARGLLGQSGDLS